MDTIDMTRYGYSDDGEWIESPTGMVNVSLWPSQMTDQTKRGLYCTSCNMYMRCLPINHDLPATHHECMDKCIAISALEACFQKNRDDTMKLYNLKSFEMDKQTGNITLQSCLFTGSSRLNSKRKIIGPTLQRKIVDSLHEIIEIELGITFESWRDFWATE
jgi:hypothetical protein